LDTYHKDELVNDTIRVRILSTETTILCDACSKQEALIYQNEGNFCLYCWQDRTDPFVTHEKIEQMAD
jgi:hypothetical protein